MRSCGAGRPPVGDRAGDGSSKLSSSSKRLFEVAVEKVPSIVGASLHLPAVRIGYVTYPTADVVSHRLQMRNVRGNFDELPIRHSDCAGLLKQHMNFGCAIAESSVIDAHIEYIVLVDLV